MDKDKAQEQKPQEIELKIPIKFEVSKPTLAEIPNPKVGKPTMGQIDKKE